MLGDKGFEPMNTVIIIFISLVWSVRIIFLCLTAPISEIEPGNSISSEIEKDSGFGLLTGWFQSYFILSINWSFITGNETEIDLQIEIEIKSSQQQKPSATEVHVNQNGRIQTEINPECFLAPKHPHSVFD